MPSASNDSNKDSQSTPPENQGAGFSRQFAMAMELPFVLVAAILVGGFVGYLLDRWLHTKPILMFVLGFLGFFGGLRDVLRRLPAK
ncbi:MAG TPA: AtpZ/AtpI family protein [Candidatus Limnocylindrales bacterium]|nr:AtpZ/AtpI family protein [Candidatus Limnocylindrales bacterium]